MQVAFDRTQIVLEREIAARHRGHLVLERGQLLFQAFTRVDDLLTFGGGDLKPARDGTQVALQGGVLFHQAQHEGMVFLEVLGDGGELALIFGDFVEQRAIGEARARDLVVLGLQDEVVHQETDGGEGAPRERCGEYAGHHHLEGLGNPEIGHPAFGAHDQLPFWKQTIGERAQTR